MPRRAPKKVETEQPAWRGVVEVVRNVNFGTMLALAGCVIVLRVLYCYPTHDVDSGWLTPLGLQLLLTLPVALDLILCGLRITWRGLIPIAFLMLIWISSIFAAYRLPAVSQAWEFSGAMLLYFAIARMPTISRRLVCALLLALAIGQAGLACWQITVSLPELRERYAKGDPEIRKSLAEFGIDNAASEGRMRDRVFSQEAFGSFGGHPNTLAGFLLICLPIAFAYFRGARDWKSRIGPWMASIVLIALAVGLLLTRSRSAWVASILAIMVFVFSQSRFVDVITRYWWRILAVLALTVVVVLMMVHWKVFDGLIFSEAGKSMSYRVEWWRATLHLIAERPFFGVGFGNFQSHYTMYKLPFSSEEIDDPHNFVLQIASCGGILASVVYCVLIASVIQRGLSACKANSERNELKTDDPSAKVSSETFAGHRWIWLGATAAAFLLAFIGTDVETIVFFLIGIMIVGVTSQWLEALPWHVIGATVAATFLSIHLNWLGAGGVAVPGLLVGLWPVAALLAPPANFSPVTAKQRFTGIGVAAVILSLFTTFVVSFWMPLAEREQRLLPLRTSKGNGLPLETVIGVLRQSIEEYPGDTKVWLKLFATYAQRMRTSQGAQALSAYHEAENAIQTVLKLDPREAFLHGELARLYADAASQKLDKDGNKRARESYEEMLRCYPNLPVNRWIYANHLLKMEDLVNAKKQFGLALWLDGTPHPDKKLTEEQRRIALQFTEPNAK